MKKTVYKSLLAVAFASALAGGCKDFEEINKDPNQIGEDAVQIEYLVNTSMYEAQQNPHIAERIFVYMWGAASRFHTYGIAATCSNSDSYNTDYASLDYLGKWLTSANQAVLIGQERIAAGTDKETDNNWVQIARIWRAYLLTEMSDYFGSVPDMTTAYQGELPKYQSATAAYKWCISELADAVTKLDEEVTMPSDESKLDQFYQGNAAKWKKYANSLRMRLAMRLVNADASYARTQFEAAVSDPAGYISSSADNTRYPEGGGWDASTGVMTRTWNSMMMSQTAANLMLGLGSVSPVDIAGIQGTAFYGASNTDWQTNMKDPNTYLGLYMPDQLSDKTNVANAQYQFNYIPSNIDPRAYVTYSAIGLDTDANFYTFGIKKNDGESDASFAWRKRNMEQAFVLTNKDPQTGAALQTPDSIHFRGRYNFFHDLNGSTGDKGSLFAINGYGRFVTTLANQFRTNDNNRIFFASWESYFLIAEAAHYGWSVPMSAQVAYEKGIDESLAYWGLSSVAATYKASTSYNRVGTSVAFTHTAEATPVTLTVETFNPADGATFTKTTYEGKPSNYDVTAMGTKTVTYNYPQGAYTTNNDVLTKIITQKWIAQMPYLPLEAWNDYRRLNLPFFENPLREIAIPDMTWYTNPSAFSAENVMARAKYPSSLSLNNQAGYEQAVAALGSGAGDQVNTPINWAKNATNKQ